MATQDPLLDPLPTNTVTGVGTLTSPDDFDRNAFVFTDDTKKDLVSYFNSKEDHPIASLTKNQKDAAVSGFKDFVKVTAQSNADPGMVLPEKFEIPAYSEYNGPIIEAQFPAVNTPDDLINFGMVDENGPTDKGSLMIDLKKIGGLNPDYTLNLTGKALLSDQEESLKPENLPIFMERKRLKLDEPEEKSWGTIWDEFSGVLKSTLDTFTAINPLVNLGVALTQDDKTKAMFDARRNAMVEAGVGGVVKFENTLASGASTIAKGLLARAVTEGKQQDVVLAALDQNFKRTQFQQQAFKSSEALHEIFGLTNWVDQMSNAKEQLGEAGFQKAQQTGEVGGQMLFSIINPLAPENVAFNMGMKLTMAPFKVAGAMVGTARVTAEKFAEASNNLEAININLAKTQAAGAAATKYSASLQTAAERLTAEGNIAAAKSIGKQIVKSNNIAQKAVFQAEQWTKLAGEASQKVDFLAPSASRANGIIKVADIAAQFPKLITTPVGFTLQKVGRGMIKIDAGLEAASQKMGAGKFYNAMTKWSSMAGIGTFGSVSGLPPSMAWFPAAFKLAWSTAPAIEAAGDFVRIVGREASAARGAIPMWRKIGRMQNAGPAHRMVAGFMDVATLGGFPVVQNAVKGGIAATVATVPVDLAFRYVSLGGETTPNTLKESIVGTSFFAGGGASLGATHMGSKGTLKKLQMGDVLNFRRSIVEPQQRMMFDAMPRGYRDAIGSYSGSKPNTPIEFVKEGGGNYDPSTNTIRINPNAKNPLRPLIAHEILESLVVQSNMGEAIRTMLVGDGVQTGGLLRDRNGNLDPKFIEFRDRYNQLRQAEVNRINQTRPPENRESFTPLNDRDMAKEYFIEMNADDMAGLAESGQLGKFAARSAASRKMIDLGNTILNKSSILRNLHFNLGGVMDSGGKMVMGNGLLADGIRQLPEAKAMFQKMVRDTAGRPNAVKMTAEKSKGSVIPTSGMDDPLWSDMTAYWKTDQAGVPIKDKSGNWMPLERHVEQAREQAGLLIQADQKQRIAAGETIPKHEIQYSPETGWRGKYFSAAQIEIIKNSGYFNDSQIRLFEHVNNAAKRGKGERFLMIYNPATSSRLRGRGRKSYLTLGPTMKEGGILGFSMGQKGQLLIDIIDTQQLHQNVMEQAGKKIGQKLYKGNIDKILTDINAVMDLHGKGESADIHFKQEYGADWKAHKDFINSTFGDISGGAKARPADYMMINPVLVTDRPTNAVFKTYRLDRLNKATAMEGTTGIPMDYNMVKANYMPDGVPLFTPDGEPVDLRYTAVEDENGLRAVPGANYGKKNGMPVEDAGGKETPAKNATVEDFNKPNEFYRVIRGSKAFDDIVKSGLVRTDSEFKPTGLSKGAIANRPTAFPSFSKGEVSKNYIAGENNHYVIATSDSSIAPSTLGRHGKGSTMFPTDANGKAMKSLDASNVDVYKHIGDGKYDLVYSNGQEVKEGGNMRPSNLAPLPETNKIPDFYNYDRIESDSGGGEADTFQSGSVFYKDYRNKQKGFGMWKDEGGAKSRPASLEEFRIRTNLHNLFFPDSKIDIIYADKDGVITSQKEVYGDQVETDDVRGLLKQKGWDHVSGDTFRHKSGAMMYDADYNGATTYEKDADGNMEAVNWIPFDVLIVPGKTRESDPSTLNRLPEPATTSYLPEGKHDRDTAIKNKDVFAKRFENFKPQVGVDGVDVGWQRPSDGKFVDTGEHYNFYKDDNGNQLGNPNEIGYVRIVKEGKDLYYEGKPNPKQLRELKDTSIELGLTLIADNESTRYLPEGDKKTKERQVIGDDMVIDKGDSDTLDVIQSVNAETQMPSWKDDKPVPVSFGYDLASAPHINKFAGKVENPSTEFLDNLPYDLNRAEYGRVKSLIENGVVDYFANKMANETRVVLKDPAIAAGKGWYSRMRVKLLNALGETGRELFSQFLGATSAQTPVDENFLQTVDAHEGMKSGRYDRHRKGYLTAIKAEMNGTLDKEIVKTKSVESIQTILSKLKDALPLAKVKADKIAIYAEIKSLTKLIETPVNKRTEAQRIKLYVVANDLLPRRSNGAKFNANSGAVLKVIAGVWLNNRESPKTPNFAGNLSGRTVQATIDIWAARYIRRMIYGGEGVPWRIQPKSEVGVSKEDFAFSQIVMERAAKKLDMNPDDLQAILWFAEKDFWDKKKWTKNEGAKKSSFDDIFDIFFPEGKKPLSFAEGSAMIKNAREQQKAIAKKEKKDNLKAEANALGISVAALTRMKKQKN